MSSCAPGFISCWPCFPFFKNLCSSESRQVGVDQLGEFKKKVTSLTNKSFSEVRVWCLLQSVWCPTLYNLFVQTLLVLEKIMVTQCIMDRLVLSCLNILQFHFLCIWTASRSLHFRWVVSWNLNRSFNSLVWCAYFPTEILVINYLLWTQWSICALNFCANYVGQSYIHMKSNTIEARLFMCVWWAAHPNLFPVAHFWVVNALKFQNQ